jgi:hypothetical protein
MLTGHSSFVDFDAQVPPVMGCQEQLRVPPVWLLLTITRNSASESLPKAPERTQDRPALSPVSWHARLKIHREQALLTCER